MIKYKTKRRKVHKQSYERPRVYEGLAEDPLREVSFVGGPRPCQYIFGSIPNTSYTRHNNASESHNKIQVAHIVA